MAKSMANVTMTHEELVAFLDRIADASPELLTQALKRRAERVAGGIANGIDTMIDQWRKITGRKT